MKSEIKYLNPDNKTDGYKIHSELGLWAKKKIDWELSVIAQKELKRASPEGVVVPSDLSVDYWLHYYAEKCPDAVFCVLENLIEPITPNAKTVKYLFENDKFEEEFIKALTANFLESPLIKRMTDSQQKLNETSSNTENATEPKEKTEQVSSDTSQVNIGNS